MREAFLRLFVLFASGVCIAACGGRSPHSQPSDAGHGIDAATQSDSAPPSDSPPTPPHDAYVPCATLGATCDTADDLEQCTTVGVEPSFTQCRAGCIATPQAHCGTIIPTGVVTTTDLEPDPQLASITIPGAGASIDTDTGAITGLRTAGTGVVSGIDFEVRGGVGVFRFADLTVSGAVKFTGSNAVALVSTNDIMVTALIDATGDCIGSDAGPGGSPGGAAGTAATGDGAGGAGVSSQGGYSGGAGGGYGAAGGIGGTSFPMGPTGPMIAGGAAGASFGDATISVLRGGGGGGGGGGPNGGVGGGGGGAIQLVAWDQIQFAGTSSSFAGVFATGCGGKHGVNGGAGGGGGGAGGSILIEAPYISTGSTFSGYDVAGGGGGANTYVDATSDGQVGSQGARGGISGGGDGGTRDYNGRTIVGGDGEAGASGGGGGGAVGRIRFNVVEGLLDSGSVMIPSPSDPVTTATQGTSMVE